VPRTKINATVQLNVKNIANSYLANPGRYKTAGSGSAPRLPEPNRRSFLLTTVAQTSEFMLAETRVRRRPGRPAARVIERGSSQCAGEIIRKAGTSPPIP
jgi:hypothetical protein